MSKSDLTNRKLKIVGIGGGTGLSTLLRSLRTKPVDLYAIITVADNGGSSGRLRKEYGILPPGDFRNCLVALSDAEPLLKELFQYRFESTSALNGHSFGNLFIMAMEKITGSFDEAIKESSKVLNVTGQLIPSTLDQVNLVAELKDGKIVEGDLIKFNNNEVGRVLIDGPYPFAIIKVTDPDIKEFEKEKLICGSANINIHIHIPDWLISKILT